MIRGRPAVALQTLQSRKSGQRLFLKQHLTASRALAPAFDQPLPALLSWLPRFHRSHSWTTDSFPLHSSTSRWQGMSGVSGLSP